MRLREMYSKLDILGEPIKLTLNGSDSIQSWFGATLTLLFIATLIAASVIFIRGYFDYTSPNVSETSDNFKKGVTVELGSGRLIPFMRVLNKSGDIPEFVDNYSVQNLFQMSLTVVTIDDNTGGIPTESQEYFYGVPCSDLSENKTMYNYLAEASNYGELKEDLDYYGFCIDTVNKQGNIKLAGNGTAVGSKTVQINIQPCSTTYNPDCVAFNSTGYSIEVFFPSFAPDFKNPSKPVVMTLDLDNGFKVNDFTLFRTEFIRPVNNLLYDENQISTSESLVGTFIDIDELGPKYQERAKDGSNNPVYACGISDFGEETCQSLYQINFVTSRSQVKFTRKYKLVTQLLSEIGGISSLLIQVFTYLNMAYLFFAKESILISQLMPSMKSQPKPKGIKKDSIQSKADDKKWKEIRSDSTKMIDASIDLTTLIQEISSIKVLTRVLFDDVQRQMILLTAIQLFRSSEKDDKKVKTDKVSSVHSSSSGNPASKDPQSHDSQENERLAFKELSKRTQNDPLSQKIDDELKVAVKELGIDYLQDDDNEFGSGKPSHHSTFAKVNNMENFNQNALEMEKSGQQEDDFMLRNNKGGIIQGDIKIKKPTN